MPLNRTAILASRSNEITSKKGHYAMLVILGANNRGYAELADQCAGDSNDRRWVVWVNSSSAARILTDDIASARLSNTETIVKMLKTNPDEVLGFAVSFTGKVVDILKANDLIDDLRIEDAFQKAEITR